ncbi:hypothetical protein [Aeromonas hydrophila]|uniref:hypothetical protein n=1 Tax=Aeromonas hydrophila TaxID=644 RepID=UPI003EC707F7
MNMLSFIEDINSSYGGPAFSLPSLLRTLDTEFHMKSQILSLTKNGALANNDVIKHFSLPAPILLEQFGTDKLKYSIESRLAFKHAQEADVIHTNNLWNFFHTYHIMYLKNLISLMLSLLEDHYILGH